MKNSLIAILGILSLCSGELIDSFGEITDHAKHIEMKKRLFLIAEKIRAIKNLFDGIRPDKGIKDDYVDQFFVNYTEGLPIMVKKIESKILRHRFGNHFGLLLSDYACAQVSGAHMILMIKSEHETVYKVSDFESYLPTVIVHQNPINYSAKAIELARRCGPYPYPWQVSDVYILREDVIPNIRKIVNHAVNNAALELFNNSTKIKRHAYDHLHSNNTIELNFSYPIVSDVSIHYRCSDNIKHSEYGLLPFPTIISIIPAEAKYIYIHTELKDDNHICDAVVKALFEDVEKAFPTSYVVVFSKRSIFETMYDFINSHMRVVCSVSTFCLHAVIGREKGDIYFPRKMYGGQSNYSYSSWHYIEQKVRTEWPQDIDRSLKYTEFLISVLRNITLYNNGTSTRRYLF